jgi:hypothetical protein
MLVFVNAFTLALIAALIAVLGLFLSVNNIIKTVNGILIA